MARRVVHGRLAFVRLSLLAVAALFLVACGTDAGDVPPLTGPGEPDAGQADGSPLVAPDLDSSVVKDTGADALVAPDAKADAGADALPPDAGAPVLCLGSTPGAYCGNDEMQGGDPRVLYQCPGPGRPPTSSVVCANGCVISPPGTPDRCATPVPPTTTFRLPWGSGTTMRLTQDCNDSCCADHVGNASFAWDFANGGGFPVLAARGGTVTHLKINSTTGCGSSTCVNNANFIVIDHGDGTHSTYLHFQGGTLGPGVTCGGTVARGQLLATAGTTGWSTGVHLHFQVSQVHPGAPTCECGPSGTGCAANAVPWANFWSSAAYPTVATRFDEWATASQCGNRRMTMPTSQNP